MQIFLGVGRELLRGSLVLGVLLGTWVASARYQERSFERFSDDVVKLRVRPECLRPDWVQSQAVAERWDLEMYQLDLVHQQLSLLNRRTEGLLDRAEQTERLRREMTTGKYLPSVGGIGGPAPVKTTKERPWAR